MIYLEQLKAIRAGLVGPKGTIEKTHPITGDITQVSIGGISEGEVGVSYYHARFLHENLNNNEYKKAFEIPRNFTPRHSLIINKQTLVKAIDSVSKKSEDQLVDTSPQEE